MYIAGNENAFFAFTNYEACICFLEENAKKDVKWQELLTSHFSIDVQDLVLNALKKGSYIDSSSLGSTLYPRPADCSFKNPHILHIIKTKPIEKSLFETIQKNTQERSYLDASAVITSDKELMLKRMALVLDSLGRALLVPSFAFPIVNWATLALLATESALNLYIAKNGDTVKERYQAAIDIGTISLEFLLLGAFLNFRSLQLSRHQKFTNQVNIRAAARGSGLQPSLKKTPTSKEAFFGTTKIMQTWQIAVPNTLFSHLDVKVWFLDEEFLLFTGKSSKAKHLIISSHGGYFPGTGIVKVPKKTELVVLGPHGWAIFDPKTENIAKKLVLPYGIINENAALPTQSAFLPSMFSHSSNVHFHPKEINVKYLAGTDVPGHIRNYSLSKYQTFEVGGESYLDIAQLVGRSRHPFPHIYGIGLDPVDVLTVRNRRGMIPPNLEDVFKSLQNNGIHYERITLEFCRANIFLSMSKTKTPPSYRPAKL
ncbi:hypothetical protein RHT_00759 [Candidatus Rhabdochlamydia sp. T3358]|nr:hypothetical protein [Candidatus Rhabdochlamydia sp. T3358]VHO03144.1 hypothetical protein RHT_00759 [Candidatus Rhabdochlamydia sp. T3358]